MRRKTVVHERFIPQIRVQVIKRLPNSIKSAPTIKAFEIRPNSFPIVDKFYSTDEFMAHYWENAQLTD